MTLDDIALRFFLQIAAILLVTRLVGVVIGRFKQPPVMAEMLGGIVLGPSLFGLLLPGAQEWLFPPEMRSILFTFAQVGIVLYMFVVGMGFKVGTARQNLRSSAAIAFAGIALPFALGGALAYFLIGDPAFFSTKTTPVQAALFLGAAMAVTAFPVLARIIEENGIKGSAVGTIALAAGSVGDAAAWCILAVVLASFGGSSAMVVLTVGGTVLYLLGLRFALRPLLLWLEAKARRDDRVTKPTLILLLALLMFCAWYTDYIRIYAVFGAFLLGVMMPRGHLRREMRRTIEPAATLVLVPMFFVYSGLNTRVGLLDTPVLWGLAVLVLAVACLGKFLGAWGAARLTGNDNRDALGIAALMNARGLVELILLTIGLRAGVITPTLFTIMAVMAVMTTLLATPLFRVFYVRGGTPIRSPALDTA